MKKYVLPFFVLLALLVSSCEENAMDADIMTSDKAFTTEYEPAATKSETIDQSTNPSGLNRKLVKNGNLKFETEDLEQSRTRILSVVKKFNGYVGSDQSLRTHAG